MVLYSVTFDLVNKAKFKKYLKEHVIPHVGHFVRAKVYPGKLDIYGKLLRTNLRPEIPASELWIESTPCPIVIYDDKLTGCECIDGPLNSRDH